MKVWSCVELFGGAMTNMNVFPTMEMAREYFHSFINNYGSVEDCDPDFYNDGEGACFYWSNGDDDAEIHIWPVKMEMEGCSMKIIRTINGIETEIELTDRELWEAYEEEQHKCDLSDIDNAFEDLTDDELMETYGKTLAELEELKEAMAYRYRKYRDEYDESWINDRDEAIRYVLMENEKYI